MCWWCHHLLVCGEIELDWTITKLGFPFLFFQLLIPSEIHGQLTHAHLRTPLIWPYCFQRRVNGRWSGGGGDHQVLWKIPSKSKLIFTTGRLTGNLAWKNPRRSLIMCYGRVHWKKAMNPYYYCKKMAGIGAGIPATLVSINRFRSWMDGNIKTLVACISFLQHNACQVYMMYIPAGHEGFKRQSVSLNW